MGTRKGRAKGVVTPTRMIVDVSWRQLRKKNAAKSARFLSTSDVSLVRRLMILPVGVTWKKDNGALHSNTDILSHTGKLRRQNMQYVSNAGMLQQPNITGKG